MEKREENYQTCTIDDVVRDILEVTLDDIEDLNLKRLKKCEEDEDLTKSTFKFDSSCEDVGQDVDDTESTVSNNDDENNGVETIG